jgi:flagellar hook-associated protein 3 FlgL
MTPDGETMSILPVQYSRVSNLLQTATTTQTINQTQQQLLTLQNELSTGKAVNQPSDNPSAASAILQLNQLMAARQGWSDNVTAATSQLGDVDTTINSVTQLLQQAQTIASQNVSSTTPPAQRTSAAAVIDTIYTQAMTLANTQFNGSYLFGGDEGGNAPFVQAAGGVQYVGSGQTLTNAFDDNTQINFQVSGDSVFGGFSSGVQGSTSLSPALTPTTRISDLKGATGSGITLGSIQIGNGTTSATVNLSSADTIQNVIDDINNAALPGVTASLSANGITITAGGGASASVNEVGGGNTASDLGILTPTAGAPNAPINGASLEAQVTQFTPLSSLNGGTGVDPTGFTITNGAQSKTISMAGLTTVGDLMNAINGAGLGVRAQINSSGGGISVMNTVQGTSMTISEAGGTTAGDLGIRSFGPTTDLSELNNGAGVQTVAGGDMDITTADGTVTNVSLTGAVTVQDVLNQINTAGGGKITASFATTGNGIVLTDNTTGAGTLTVTPLNDSAAATDLGLTTPAVGNTITGTDVNPMTTSGIFTDLQNLSNALKNNDTDGITTAAEGLATDSSQATLVRATAGAKSQELQAQATQITAENTATQSMISQLQDVDYTTAITQFQTLQTSLQAALETAAQSQNMSLAQFLA